MRSIRRTLLRALALVLLLAVLVGVPVVVARTVGMPVPSWQQWRSAIAMRRVSTDFVVRLGAAVFVLLWSWFACTAVAEFGRVWHRRRDPHALPPLARADGPAWWVRGMVRFIAVSSVSAGALAGGLGVVHGAARAAAPVAHEHVVEAGDSYWRIAQHHLDEAGKPVSMVDVHELTMELVAFNSPRLGHRDPTLLLPGEVVRFESVPMSVAPPAVAPPSTVASPPTVVEVATPPLTSLPATSSVPVTVPRSVAPSTAATPTTSLAPAVELVAEHDDSTSMVVLGLAGAALLAGGAVRTIDARRRRGWRASSVGARVSEPTFEQVRTELALRVVDADEQLVRLDVVLRSVARDIASQGACVLLATVGDHGEVRLFLRGAATPSDLRWRLQMETGAWLLPGDVPLGELVEAARTAALPCPALLHLGCAVDGSQVFADLEAMGLLGVDSPVAPSVVRTASTTLSLSPFRATTSLIATAMPLPGAGVECIDDPSDAVTAAVSASAGVAACAISSSTFSLRSLGGAADSWDPVLLLSGVPVAEEVLADIGGGRGLGVLMAGATEAHYCLRSVGDRHVLEPFGLQVVPLCLDAEVLHDVVDAVEHSAHELEDHGVHDALWSVMPKVSISPAGEPEWDLVVNVLGNVSVRSRSGEEVQFERSKSLELVVWLSQHRERPTRSAARAALWDLSVRDATFANVVSDARRAMGRAVAPPEGEEWIGRTLTEALPLHARVVTDADLLQQRVQAARSMPAHDAVAMLRPGLEAITGMPFADTTFLWTDAEGHTSALVLLATGAAIEMASHALALGDIDGVFWATGQGLKVLPGHEELIALRMRAHASRGDLSGVRQEWESYERALAAEPWASNDPAPKLCALRRELLATGVSSGRS